MINVEAFCRTFYASHHIPLGLYRNGKELFTAGFPNNMPTYQHILYKLLASTENPSICTMPGMELYGLIRLDDGSFIVLGPVYCGDINYEMLKEYMFVNTIESAREVETRKFLSSIPQYNYHSFVYLILHLHLVLNGEELSVTERFGISDTHYENEVSAKQAEKSISSREESKQHGTYFFEKQMLEYVKQGIPEQIRSFLLETVSRGQPLTEGTLAQTPLRQAKNLFIGAVTIVGKFGAIPGGLDIEYTYQLIDTYVQECERLNTLEEIKSLQFNMIMDFTSRVQQSKLPENISDEIQSAIQFTSLHITESISVEDIAEHIGRSRAYLSDKFKKETGKTVGEYITELRMREARILLKYTDKSLSEISNYLNFSSQSYFQNVFKKQYGITPGEFRNKKQK